MQVSLSLLLDNAQDLSLNKFKGGEAQRRRAVARQTVDRIAHQLLNQSKLAVASTEEGEKRTARDLLSLLVRANTDKALPDEQRLSDEDVCARMCTRSIFVK